MTSAERLRRTHEQIDAYFAAKLEEHGATPRGVDWTCVATQKLRFVQLLQVCDRPHRLSINDVGCGYGALLAFFRERHPNRAIDYVGIDLSAAMVSAARLIWRSEPTARFHVGATSPRTADFSVASGLFNVCLSIGRSDWEIFVRTTLLQLRQSSSKGFAVNFMAPQLIDAPCVPELYRTAPEPWADFCTNELGGRVRVVQGYGLREFTLLVEL